ncbi:MAG: hypothetical protein HWE16_09570 [Gammaproteobacteria bacterium]|nr:hypothetical protein [Gammaproteobacteria bacterium]
MKIKLGLAIATLALITACKSLVPVMDINNHAVVKESSLQNVEKAILAGAATRGWTPRVVKPGHITASINVRSKHQAVVDIFYTAQDYSIKYNQSYGLKYDASSREIHPNYNNWMVHLKNSINAELYKL